MPKVKSFVQDFQAASSSRGEVQRNEAILKTSYAKLLETLRSALVAEERGPEGQQRKIERHLAT